MKKRTTTQKPGALAKKHAAPAAKQKGPGGKLTRHPPRAAAAKKPIPKHNAPEGDEEEEDVEVNEEDRAFVEEHSAFAASLLSLAPDASKDKRKDKKKDPMPAPPKSPAHVVEAKKKNKRAHSEGQDDEEGEEVLIETKAMRRNASTQGWDTARGVGNKVMKERLPTKTIDGTIQFRTEEVEEETEEERAVVEMEVVAPVQEEAQPQDGEEEEEEEYDDEEPGWARVVTLEDWEKTDEGRRSKDEAHEVCV